MSVDPDFATVEEADATYYGDGGDGSTSNRWGEPQTVPTDWRAGWGLSYQQNLDDSEVRRYFVTRQNPQNGDLEALTEQGQITTFTAETPGDEIPHFESESTARSAYQAWAESNGDQSAQWGQWQELEESGVWLILRRESADGTREQFAAAYVAQNQEVVYLQEDGSVDSSIHPFANRDDLQLARSRWQNAQANGEIPEELMPAGKPDEDDVNDDTEGEQWGEWQRIEQVQQWQIWGREHQTEDRAQFMVASTNQAGDEIYLHPGGEVKGQPHLYDSVQAVRDALNAFATKMENGEVPEGQRPTGNSPSREQIRRAATSVTGGGPGGGSLPGPVGAAVDAVGGPVNAAILATAAVGGVYYLEREGHIDLTEQVP